MQSGQRSILRRRHAGYAISAQLRTASALEGAPVLRDGHVALRIRLNLAYTVCNVVTKHFFCHSRLRKNDGARSK
jgi:uncharacterized protein (DUF2237 family)